MLRSRRIAIVVTTLLLAISEPASAQIISGQIDNFQDGTTMNWTNGVPATDPINIPNGGPLGAGDRYLQISSNGNVTGSGSHLTAFNRVQWIGNYISAGVTSVEMDLKNFGTSPSLSMHISFKTTQDISSSGYVSTPAFTLPNDGQWHHVIFNLDSSSLTAVNSPAPLNTFFMNPMEMRIFHSTSSTDLNGGATAGNPTQLGVDNIHAVPEPGTLTLGFVALGCCGIARRFGSKKMNGTSISI